MHREISVVMDDMETMTLDSTDAGYAGENNATALNVFLPSEAYGYTITPMFKNGPSGNWIAGDEFFDTDFTYQIPGEMLVAGELLLVLKFEMPDEQTLYSPVAVLNVKRGFEE
jgi:hypothetical protein